MNAGDDESVVSAEASVEGDGEPGPYRSEGRSRDVGQRCAPGRRLVNGVGERGERAVEIEDAAVQVDPDALGLEVSSPQTLTRQDLEDGETKLPETDAGRQGTVDADVDQPRAVFGEARRDGEREARIVHDPRLRQ